MKNEAKLSLRHLRGAIAFEAGQGATCMHRAAALALDLPRAEIYFGTFRPASPEEVASNPRASPEPFIHAWVEWEGRVFAPTLVEKLGGLHPINRQHYYETNSPRDVHKLPRAEFDKIARRFRLSAAFRHLKARAGHGEYVDAMLTAAGVKWKESERGTILPAEC